MFTLDKRGRRRLLSYSIIFIGIATVCLLLGYRIGSLLPGLSPSEVSASTQVVGWHGIYHDVLYLPLKFIRSIVFVLFPIHGRTLTRLPNLVFGLLTIAAFYALINFWHGRRTAILSTAIFTCSAWVLHASRLASFDIMYLWGIMTLLLMHVVLYRYGEKLSVWLSSAFIWGILLTIPGFVWLVLFELFLQRQQITTMLKTHNVWWHYTVAFILFAVWIPLIVIDVIKPGQLKYWLGAPHAWPSVISLVIQLGAVLVHLTFRGPLYPELWLARQPVFDVFVLAAAVAGIYFYANHIKNSRTHMLIGFGAISAVLVAMQGAVSFSLVVPFIYILAATGITVLLHEWLKTFPRNPLARGLGIGIITLAVVISCVYNLRSYFVAWPNYPQTIETFSDKPV